tara:strand:- start:3401 stop:3628 length:228 start_codon:yes stop_codon:yes gene_type:complete
MGQNSSEFEKIMLTVTTLFEENYNKLDEIIQRLEEMDKRLDIIEEQTEQKTFEYEFNDFMTFMFSDLNEGDEYEL